MLPGAFALTPTSEEDQAWLRAKVSAGLDSEGRFTEQGRGLGGAAQDPAKDVASVVLTTGCPIERLSCRLFSVLTISTGLRGRGWKQPKVLVLMLVQSHPSFVALGKSLHISGLMSLAVD